MKVLILEDEAPAYRRLNKLLEENHPDIEVIEVLDSISEACEWIENNNPVHLIFSDIHLSDGLSFEIFERTNPKCPVIFTTAFDQYMMEAFQNKGIDYLLKPIDLEALNRSIAKYKELQSEFSNTVDPNLKALVEHLGSNRKQYKSRLLLKIGAKLKPIGTSEIAYFQFKEGSVEIITTNQKSYPYELSLDELETQLNPEDFFRVNRQFIIHIQSIQHIHYHFKGRLKIELQPNPDIEVYTSRERSKAFKNWLS